MTPPTPLTVTGLMTPAEDLPTYPPLDGYGTNLDVFQPEVHQGVFLGSATVGATTEYPQRALRYYSYDANKNLTC